MTIRSELQHIIQEKSALLNDWFAHQYSSVAPVFYSSVDIRDCGYKIAPIDTNIFPGGFNNISTEGTRKAVALANECLQKYGSKVLIVPESHTRNEFYLENLRVLERIINDAGREVSVAPVEELIKVGDYVETNNGYRPDIVILNNDLSGGVADVLNGIAQHILPSTAHGWFNRKKSHHFEEYRKLVDVFCADFGLDPFFLSAMFSECDNVNFQDAHSIESLGVRVEEVLQQIRVAYKNHGIKDEPYVFIKANRGTYGMGIMTAKSGEDVVQISRKTKKKMHAIKSGVINDSVIIQEGLGTQISYHGATAEPLVYCMSGEPVETFLRVNEQRTKYDNLNKQGVKFMPFTANIDGHQYIDVYQLVAKIATLAVIREAL